MPDTPELAVMRACGRNSPLNVDRTEETAWAIGRCCANGWLEPSQWEGNYVPTEQGRRLIYDLHGVRHETTGSRRG
jgi:hypothetical protein